MHSLTFAILGLALQANLSFGCNPQPDPEVLLMGVASVREQIPSSWLHIRVEDENVFGVSQTEYTVFFAGPLRYFAETNGATNTRILYNGSEVMYFDGRSDVLIRDLDSQMPNLLFDPRILGISALYTWGRTIEGLLHLTPGRNSEVRLLGMQEIGGKAAWRVQILNSSGSEVELWINEKAAFAVYKKVERGQYGSRIARSYYENSGYAWLPSRVQTEEFRANGSLESRRTISILAAVASIQIPTNTWTLGGLLAGVELPTWVPVSDSRSGERVGYWRDGQLGPPLPWEPAPSPPPLSSKRMISMGLMTVVLLVPVAVLAWRRFSRHRRGGVVE
jgi:hypothetical protein